jgi:hypothetical protein
MNKAVYLFASVLIFALASCNKRSMPTLENYIASKKKPDNPNLQQPNYQDLYYWAAHPQIKDCSDSVPTPLRKNITIDKKVDVFFLHPTSLLAKDGPLNASLYDEAINKSTDYGSILYQASAFNEHALVYAPRYRQSNINNYYVADRATTNKYFDTAYSDIKEAFEYYLKNNNNGRPIIIASHSQGTEHAARLIKEYFENKPLLKQLVAAYLIGMPIPENYFAEVPACETPVQTSCACSWRTVKSGYLTRYMKKESFNSIVTNPLTFTRAKGLVSRINNKGAVLQKFNTIVPKVAAANVNNKALEVPKLHFFGSIFFRNKNLHIGDINLFYVNIRENVAQRIAAYFAK